MFCEVWDLALGVPIGMPIDTHSYLVQRGWKGKGTGLKEGGIERPVIQAQKKNLKGLGKDRDDGFQFWDQ